MEKSNKVTVTTKFKAKIILLSVVLTYYINRNNARILQTYYTLIDKYTINSQMYILCLRLLSLMLNLRHLNMLGFILIIHCFYCNDLKLSNVLKHIMLTLWVWKLIMHIIKFVITNRCTFLLDLMLFVIKTQTTFRDNIFYEIYSTYFFSKFPSYIYIITL